MHFASTRSPQTEVSFSTAVTQGLAPDGGLYVPSQWPSYAAGELPLPQSHEVLAPLALPLLQPFVTGDVLEDARAAITREAVDFPAPQFWLDPAQRLGCWSCFTARPRRSRISVRDFWLPRSRGCGALRTGRCRCWWPHPATPAEP